MNTDTIVHPKLHHFGLTTANLDLMVDWYHNVLGMTVNHRSEVPFAGQNAPPFSAFAFVSNDEADHRIVFFEKRDAQVDAEKLRRTGLQHLAFECATLDDLLGTYVRLKGLGILPVWAADHGVGTSIYYQDPDQSMVEINVNNYGNAWTATERIRSSRPNVAHVDPEKMVVARKAAASAWELHERAVAGEFAPTARFNTPARF